MNKLLLIASIALLLFFLSAGYQEVSAACINWQKLCYDCSCSTPGCNGNRLCYGQDDVTQQSCNISESCNLPAQNAIRSCDCASGSYENGAFQIEGVGACNAPIQCIGDTGIAKSGLSGPTCHYCATAVSPTGIPPAILPTPTITYKSTSNPVTLPGKQNENPPATGSTTQCSGTPVSFGVQKELLPLPNQGSCSQTLTGACGRPGNCTTPNKIVMHVTGGGSNAQSIYDYFASGSDERGVGTQFTIGKDGQTIQMTETLDKQVEVAYGVANYADHISIEMVSDTVYPSKNDPPQAQYNAALNLVKKLMNQYDIPVGNLEYDWTSDRDTYNPTANWGVFGHYQLNPATRSDPGSGWLRDFRADLMHASPSSPTIPPTPTPIKTSSANTPVEKLTITRGNQSLQRIALTFDYGQGTYGRGEKLSSSDYTTMNQILDILEKHHAKATVFPTGTFYDDPANSSLLARMKSDGFEFANHTYDHKSVTGTSNSNNQGAGPMSSAEFQTELDKTETAALQSSAQSSTKPYFRYPFLDENYADTLAQKGYYNIRMTCDGGDWRAGATADTVLGTLVGAQCKQPGSIIILHGYTPQTAGALDNALTDYENSGYKVTILTDVLEGIIP